VLLTFDDGRASVWTVAAPLLRRRGMRAVSFVVPGRVPTHDAGPTWDDVLAGRAAKHAVLARESRGPALLSWAEIDELARSGTFEFQSHTLSHARVHTAPRLAGFATPGSRLGYDAFDQPLVRSGGSDLMGEQVPLGTPLLHSAARTSDELRFFEDEALRDACVRRVEDEGGARFFERPGWQGELRRSLGRTVITGRRETPGEQSAHIRRELAEARRTIEARTGRSAVHLCYPWHVAGTLARELAAEAGYVTAFCGKVTGVTITKPGGDLLRIARLGEDYVGLLPGEGRDRLAHVLRRKWIRRFRRSAG
jgi:peptidoglycan/xylan/chitin deacetylase (PgdA/CDA1 family)